MPKNNLSNKGFTLIELIVVTTIIGLISTYGFSAYRKSQQIQNLKQAGSTIEETLTEVQKKVEIGQKNCSGKLEGYRVTLINSNNQIEIDEICESDTHTQTPTSVPNTTFTSSTTQLFFNTLNKGITIEQPTGVSETNITFTVEGSAQEGTINIQEPLTIKYQGI